MFMMSKSGGSFWHSRTKTSAVGIDGCGLHCWRKLSSFTLVKNPRAWHTLILCENANISLIKARTWCGTHIASKQGDGTKNEKYTSSCSPWISAHDRSTVWSTHGINFRPNSSKKARKGAITLTASKDSSVLKSRCINESTIKSTRGCMRRGSLWKNIYCEKIEIVLRRSLLPIYLKEWSPDRQSVRFNVLEKNSGYMRSKPFP